MKVGYIFLHPLCSSLGSTVRLRELTSNLGNNGVESIIFNPYEGDQILFKNVKILSTGGLTYKLGFAGYLYRFSKYAYYNHFFIKHFLTSEMLQFRLAKKNALPIIKALKNNTVNIIQVEQDFAIPTSLEVKKKTGIPIVADIHNITPEELVACGAIKRESLEFRKLQKMQKDNLELVDEIVVVSELMKDYVIETYSIPSKRVHVVPPGGFHYASIKNPKNPPIVVYAGLVSYREHVDLFIKSIPIVQEKFKEVQFYITGKGEDLKKIKQFAKELNIRPVFFWYPTKEDFRAFLSTCTVGVLPSSNDIARQMGTPAKLFDYLSVGLPVVANDVGGWSDIIKNFKVGLLSSDEPAEFACALIKILENSELRQAYVLNGLELIKGDCNWGTSAKILLETYHHLIFSNSKGSVNENSRD